MKSRKRRKKKNGLLIGAVIVIFIIAGAVGGFSLFMSSADRAFHPDDTQMINVAIPSGTGTSGIASILEQNGIIASGDTFRLQSRLKGLDGKYKAGEYALSPSMTTTEIMDVLISGNVNTMRFTVPEGYDLRKTEDKLSAEGFINRELFEQEIESGNFPYEFLKDAPQGANRLEGYLFPNTYDVFTTATEHDIIDRMLRQFDAVFTDECYQRTEELGLSINEVVTIASLIERETRVDSERAVVASVIYNRLARGQKLQIDATIQYALDEPKEFLTYADLEIDSPYNTYKIDGLPPGPICSPGEASIMAALYPESTDYIYYVLGKELNGAHKFTADYNQFLVYKDEYKQAIRDRQ